jgi:triacylglycerol lipase
MVGCGGGPGPTAPTPSGYTATHNPIVLMTGLLGFQSLLGVIDYFPAIPATLTDDGAQVYTVQVSQAADSYVRGEEVIAQLQQLRATTGATRFNLIAHSQGAVDARYIAATRPDLVASITSINGPHLGSTVADWALTLPLGLGPDAIQALGDLFKLLSGSSGANDAKAALTFLSTKNMAAWDLKYPAAVPKTNCGEGDHVVDGIYYFSWGSQGWLTNAVDLLDGDWLLLGINDPQPNDGLVNRCSMHLGQVVRDDYLGNHIDATNLLFGLVSPFGPDPKALYRAQANRLRNLGL